MIETHLLDVRFSNETQRHGASLDRQIEAATKYAHNHSLVRHLDVQGPWRFRLSIQKR